MTPRSLFNIILKVLGILLIKDALVVLPQLFSVFYIIVQPGGVTEGIFMLLTVLATLLIYWFIFYYLVFKSELIIDQLHLDKGFTEESFSMQLHRSSILTIACIVIGGLLIVDGIPQLCRDIASFFQEKRLTHGLTDPSTIQMIVSSVKVIIGLLLIGSRRQVVNFIELKRKK